MTSYINFFLKTEITVIPSFLSKCVGKYYNNTICNGASWMFFLWYILHVSFDQVLNAIFKKMRYKEYIRIWLKGTLWYLGFYTTSCIYCVATLLQNNINIYDMKNSFNSLNASEYSTLGFIILSTFYLHSALWEGLKYNRLISALSYTTLFFLLSFSYCFGFLQGIFKLITVISISQISLELARLLIVLSKNGENRGNVLNNTMLILASASFIINYFLIIPLLLAYSLFKERMIVLPLLLSIWLILEISNSVVVKSINHSFHKKHKSQCNRDLIECSLFPLRDDATYNFLSLRKEIWEREEKCLTLRKPKNRSVVMQTLKCMVAIKRKLNQKRQIKVKEINSLSDSVDNKNDETDEHQNLEDTTSHKKNDLNVHTTYADNHKKYKED